MNSRLNIKKAIAVGKIGEQEDEIIVIPEESPLVVPEYLPSEPEVPVEEPVGA